jgi:pimeloyl-ACP methyl ester carboxylesterase
MPEVISPDGTTIVYDRSGAGPALILIDGAMCHRSAGPMQALATLLTDHFTVYTYDRRGRGESGDTAPYAPEREAEDVQALIAEAGGTAYLYAMSSGGAVALRTPGAAGVVLYEPPFGLGTREYTDRLRELLAAGSNGDAVALFMRNVGVPEPVVTGMRNQPGFASVAAIAPTLAYDDELLTEMPADQGVPLLVVSGSASPESLQKAARMTAEAFPGADHRTLEGQTHDVQPAALAPVLIEFLRNAGAGPR